jgi:hypothetical protein
MAADPRSRYFALVSHSVEITDFDKSRDDRGLLKMLV